MSQGNIVNLEESIERLVRNHVASYEAELRAQLQRSFTSGSAPRMRVSNKSSPTSKAKRSSLPRRTPEELARLGERFYEVLQGCPGETMSVLCKQLDVTPESLERPVVQLKKDMRVRTVGERSQTRYFPMMVPPPSPTTPPTSI